MSGVFEADSESVIGGLGDGLPVRASQFICRCLMEWNSTKKEKSLLCGQMD